MTRNLKPKPRWPNGLWWGKEVWKTGSGYSGPGEVRGFAITRTGELRVVVAHQIKDGDGDLLHIYDSKQLS